MQIRKKDTLAIQDALSGAAGPLLTDEAKRAKQIRTVQLLSSVTHRNTITFLWSLITDTNAL